MSSDRPHHITMNKRTNRIIPICFLFVYIYRRVIYTNFEYPTNLFIIFFVRVEKSDFFPAKNFPSVNSFFWKFLILFSKFLSQISSYHLFINLCLPFYSSVFSFPIKQNNFMHFSLVLCRLWKRTNPVGA